MTISSLPMSDMFDAITDWDNLWLAFYKAARGKRRGHAAAGFEHQVADRLIELQRDLQSFAYRPGAYRHFVIHEPKRRKISAAPFRDRVVHHAIVSVLEPLLARRFIADTYACLPGRGTHRAAYRYREFVRARRGGGYRLQCDIKSYFASVDHRVMMALLARCLGDARMLELLHSLLAHGAESAGKGMPIGNLTSQLFANLYLDPFDHFVKEALRVRHYIRYMDDFLLLSDSREGARAHLAAAADFLQGRLLLQLNQRRTVIAPVHCPCDFLGYVHHAGGRVRVRRRSVRRLWRRLPALERRLAAGEITWETARASVASWFGVARHANAFRLSRTIFGRRDVRHAGKRLLVKSA